LKKFFKDLATIVDRSVVDQDDFKISNIFGDTNV